MTLTCFALRSRSSAPVPESQAEGNVHLLFDIIKDRLARAALPDVRHSRLLLSGLGGGRWVLSGGKRGEQKDEGSDSGEPDHGGVMYKAKKQSGEPRSRHSSREEDIKTKARSGGAFSIAPKSGWSHPSRQEDARVAVDDNQHSGQRIQSEPRKGRKDRKGRRTWIVVGTPAQG